MALHRSPRERSPFGTRMYLARQRVGLTQMEVREALGISQGTLSELEGVAASSGKVVDFAKLYEVDAAWLASGDGIAPPDLGQGLGESLAASLLDATRRGIIDGNRRLSAVAHPPSPSPATFAHERATQHVAWGELGMRELEGTFSVNAPDDSMAPVIKRGALVDFDGSMEPRTDDVVLLKDGGGVWYIRTYQQGPRARWGARAENGSYMAMDSERDELKVIAVLTAVRGRRG